MRDVTSKMTSLEGDGIHDLIGPIRRFPQGRCAGGDRQDSSPCRHDAICRAVGSSMKDSSDRKSVV